VADAPSTTPTPTAGGNTQVAADNPSTPATEETQDGTSTDETTEKPKRADGGFQRRINRLTADFRAAEAKAAAAEATARELAARLQTQTTAPNADDPRPPRLEDFRSYEEYERADREFVAQKATRDAEKRFKAEQARAEREAFESEERRRALDARKRFETNAEAVAESYEDFAEVMDDMWRDRIPVISRNPAIAAYIVEESDRGPEVAYHLANNKDVADRIGRLSPLGQVKELVKLEASLPKPNAPATNAPPPPRNVGSRGGPDTKDPAKMTIDEMRRATGTKRKVDY
jgi:hypothetical protein